MDMLLKAREHRCKTKTAIRLSYKRLTAANSRACAGLSSWQRAAAQAEDVLAKGVLSHLSQVAVGVVVLAVVKEEEEAPLREEAQACLRRIETE